ncbi:2-C-methyl-D-erythritol 4-phosphate cytidylyltransferase [Arcanobacterium phocae]|uniref:2-C-methyl-D-erythritol 4-phosphate cytidylyltransferase n=1 Tax=Arcanobacterium phocae TaxID=131112 RepID=A0A1H2LCT3_9ACTO|nr:2-C-methyl-D-erythritol 4-phosphate cytidylyltransferase [Arcanobacterium phocae]SDU78827.1 2-C-methyl-D-erythritol 4-phosphate cytidylyltransferase [Arcanobacterium phocae]
MSWSAVITAAGSGTRLGAQCPKALVEIDGTPLVVHAVRTVVETGITDCIVTVPQGYEDEFGQVFDDAQIEVRVVIGGATRQDSVARGLAQVQTQSVLVHDAARALTPTDMITRVVHAVDQGAIAAIPVLPVVDTIKCVNKNKVLKTLDRSQLRAVQTPQGFDTDLLRRAHKFGERLSAAESSAAPDDAALVELMGNDVVVVDGSADALKITTPFDLAVAELIYQQTRNVER